MLLPQFLPINQHDRQPRHALEMLIAGDERKIAFERSRGNQRIHITDKIARRTKCAANIGVSLEDGIREQRRLNSNGQSPQCDVMSREIHEAFEVFDNFTVGKDACNDFSALYPRSNETIRGDSSKQI